MKRFVSSIVSLRRGSGNPPRSRTPALLALLALASCASTDVEESWVSPSLESMPPFEKVFVAYLGADAATERKAEDALAARLSRSQVVKCYEIFPDATGAMGAVGGADDKHERMDAERVKNELRLRGCDGAVVLRLARVEQQVSMTPGSYPAAYHSFGGYWGYGYGYSSVDVRTNDIVHVETNVYSLKDDQLLYAARSETFEPSSVSDLIEEVANAVAEDLKEKGITR